MWFLEQNSQHICVRVRSSFSPVCRPLWLFVIMFQLGGKAPHSINISLSVKIRTDKLSYSHMTKIILSNYCLMGVEGLSQVSLKVIFTYYTKVQSSISVNIYIYI